MKEKNKTTALFLGRFQPLHLGHIHIIEQLSKKHEKVILLVGTKQKKGEKNPFSFFDRKKMINAVLKKAKIKNYKIVGICDHKKDKDWFFELAKKVPKNSIMYSGNKDMWKLFKEYKFPIKRIKIYRGICATKVRDKIRKHEKWIGLVSKEVYDYILKNKLEEKVK